MDSYNSKKSHMQDFHMTADIHFKARNIDDAFFLLHRHFYQLYSDPDKEAFQFLGEIEIGPVRLRNGLWQYTVD